MASTVNDRIISLLKTKGWDEIKVASLIGKDKSTLYRITGKEVVPQKNTVKLIAEACGVDFGELYYGEKVTPIATEKSSISEALLLLREQLKEKDDQIRSLLAVMSKLNFLEAFGKATGPLMFPNRKQGTVSRAAA